MLLFLVEFGIHQDPQVLFSKAAFQSVSLQYVLVYGVVPPQVQDFSFLLVELH